jgi:hypothetical protein
LRSLIGPGMFSKGTSSATIGIKGFRSALDHRVDSGHRIVAARVQWVTTSETSDSQPAALQGTVLFNRLVAIDRARWVKATGWWKGV